MRSLSPATRFRNARQLGFARAWELLKHDDRSQDRWCSQFVMSLLMPTFACARKYDQSLMVAVRLPEEVESCFGR